jgi:hypothetical protein
MERWTLEIWKQLLFGKQERDERVRPTSHLGFDNNFILEFWTRLASKVTSSDNYIFFFPANKCVISNAMELLPTKPSFLNFARLEEEIFPIRDG